MSSFRLEYKYVFIGKHHQHGLCFRWTINLSGKRRPDLMEFNRMEAQHTNPQACSSSRSFDPYHHPFGFNLDTRQSKKGIKRLVRRHKDWTRLFSHYFRSGRDKHKRRTRSKSGRKTTRSQGGAATESKAGANITRLKGGSKDTRYTGTEKPKVLFNTDQ